MPSSAARKFNARAGAVRQAHAARTRGAGPWVEGCRTRPLPIRWAERETVQSAPRQGDGEDARPLKPDREDGHADSFRRPESSLTPSDQHRRQVGAAAVATLAARPTVSPRVGWEWLADGGGVASWLTAGTICRSCRRRRAGDGAAEDGAAVAVEHQLGHAIIRAIDDGPS